MYIPTTLRQAPPASHSLHAQAPAAPELIALVDFKWLMAGQGHHVDMDRLQQDPAYARAYLALAVGSNSATLRRAAEYLGRALGG